MSSATSSPVAGSNPPCPERKTQPSALSAGENGPCEAGASLDVISFTCGSIGLAGGLPCGQLALDLIEHVVRRALARLEFAPRPLLEVGVAADEPLLHRDAVDLLLKPRRQLA